MPARAVTAQASSAAFGVRNGPGYRGVFVDTDTETLKFGASASESADTFKEAMDLSSSQTATNKTLTAPTITAPTITGAATIGAGATITDPTITNPLITGPTPINLTAATLAVAAATHAGKTVTINKADGTTITLPAATGTGNKYPFFVGTTVTSNQIRFNVTGNDAYFGILNMLDLDASAAAGFAAGTDADQIDLNGTTKGGTKGDWIEFEDVATDTWAVRGNLQVPAGSNVATPFATGQIS